MKKEELKRKDLDEQRKMALDMFERRFQNTLKKQQMENERRQKVKENLRLTYICQELEEARQREILTRKKNIEMLINKKADRERNKSKHYSPNPNSRKSKDGVRFDDSQDKDEMKYHNLKAAYNVNNDRNRSLGNIAGNSNSSPMLHHSQFANEISSSVKGGLYRDRVERDAHIKSN